MNKEQKINAIKSELLAVRDTCATNMIDLRRVKKKTHQQQFENLSEYITKNPNGYTNAIFTGEIQL